MYAVDELKQAGFEVWTESGKIRYKQINERPVNEKWASNLLQSIKEHKQEAIEYLKSVSRGAELLSSSIEYLAGISEDLTGWTLWRRIEDGKKHCFAKDAGGVIRWERWYSLNNRLIPAGWHQPGS